MSEHNSGSRIRIERSTELGPQAPDAARRAAHQVLTALLFSWRYRFGAEADQHVSGTYDNHEVESRSSSHVHITQPLQSGGKMTYELDEQQPGGIVVTHIPPELASESVALEPETELDSSPEVYRHVMGLLYDFSQQQLEQNRALGS